MTLLAHSQSSWILGEGCLEPLSRLWSLHISRNPADEVKSFLPDNFASDGPALLSNHASLDLMEKYFQNESGRSFGKTHPPDFDSRILTEIYERFPEADATTSDAIALLSKSVPWIGQLFAMMISGVIPIYHEKYGRPFRRGTSHIDHLGFIFTSYIERIKQNSSLMKMVLAVDLAHELGHQALMLFQLSDSILRSPLKEPVYSSVRRENRPAIMALHGTIASAYMMEICHNIIHGAFSELGQQYCKNTLSQLSYHQSRSLEALKTTHMDYWLVKGFASSFLFFHSFTFS
jgi:hypothetical protein